MSSPQVLGVLHPVIVTADMRRALTFYGDLLGLTVQSATSHDPAALERLGGPAGARAKAAVLAAPDGTEVEIACFSAPKGRPRAEAGWPDAGIRSITFVVDDIAGMLDRLARAGYSIAGEVVSFELDAGPVRVAYVNGPDGVVLTLLERGHRR